MTGTGFDDVDQITAQAMETRVRHYMDACTSGDADAIAGHLTADAVHYFPPGMYGGAWRGGEVIAGRWAAAVSAGGSSWTVDRVAIDVSRQEAVCEWTHFKTADGVVLRGTEWYLFAGGLICEIRAYYAAPQSNDMSRQELDGFDYAERGYPMTPPIPRLLTGEAQVPPNGGPRG